MFKHLKKIENLIVLLVAVSAIAIFFYKFVPRELTIRPGEDWKTITADDQYEGGNSIATDLSSDSHFSYSYDIRPGRNNPYTSLIIEPTKEQLFDLSWMESVSITAHMEGEGSGHYRFQLRNRDEKFFVPGDSVSLRYNEVCLKLTNEGECQMIVSEIKFSGRWISASLFYKSMLAIWLGFGSLVALSQIIGLRRSLMQSKSIELSLQRQASELTQLATHDPLTQLYNRLGMRTHVTAAISA